MVFFFKTHHIFMSIVCDKEQNIGNCYFPSFGLAHSLNIVFSSVTEKNRYVMSCLPVNIGLTTHYWL